MVVPEVEMEALGPVGSESSKLRDESCQRTNGQSKNAAPSVSPLGRQSSIYSLTLDEFQRTLSGGGKNFGSMNMDEFLASIWTAEENQHNQGSTMCSGGNSNSNLGYSSSFGGVAGADLSKGLPRQQSLTRQGSLTLPSPLCGKTVDEVWTEIHRNGRSQFGGEAVSRSRRSGGDSDCNSRQPTFGEMTLEDFLIKAGVVREQESNMTFEADHQHQPLQQKNQLGVYQGGGPGNSSSNRATGCAYKSVVPASYNGCGGGSAFGQSGIYEGRLGCNNYMSKPAVYEGMVSGVGDVSAAHLGMDLGNGRNRKRLVDGPTEKVVERKQRRMIKNRESAARSRARKQAYTVELETELNHLKEENKQLKQALMELERKRRLQCMEEIRLKAPTNAKKTTDKLFSIRRNMSCPL